MKIKTITVPLNIDQIKLDFVGREPAQRQSLALRTAYAKQYLCNKLKKECR